MAEKETAAAPVQPVVDINALVAAAVSQAVAALQPRERVPGPRKGTLTNEQVEALRPGGQPGERYLRAVAVIEAHGSVHVLASLLAASQELEAFEQDAALARARAELPYSERAKVEGHPQQGDK